MDEATFRLPLSTRLFAHIETWRPYTACYIGLVGLAGAAFAVPKTEGTLVLLSSWLIPTMGWLAGLYGGDYFDRGLDSQAKPHRPIPSGRMAARTALNCMLVIIAIGAVLTLLINWRAILLVTAATVLGVAYNSILKARGLLGNAARGSLSLFAFLFGAMMAAPWPTGRLLLAGLVFMVHDTGSNLIGAIRDVEGDRAAGYQTLPARHGVGPALTVCAGCWVIWVLLAGLSERSQAGWSTLALFTVAAVLGVLALAITAHGRSGKLRIKALRAHKILCVERIILASAAISVGLGSGAAILAMAPAILITLFTQAVLRDRHELGTPLRDVNVDTIESFVDASLSAVARQSATPNILRGWERLIHIKISDLDHPIGLTSVGARLSRERPGDAAPLIHIETTSSVFARIFLDRTDNPRRAYLAGDIMMDASARDMLRINQLFNLFLRSVDTAPTAVARPLVQDREPPQERQMPPRFVLSDTTLRDGEQMPGVSFDATQKLKIARSLADMGIPLIEAGFPAISEDEATAVRSVVEAGLSAEIQVIARPVNRDIDVAISTGAHQIAIFIGTSDSHVHQKLRITRRELLDRVARSIDRAKSSGRSVVFAAEDATRTDPEFLCQVYHVAAQSGCDALGLADTAGIATPWSLADLVTEVNRNSELPVAVHCHNDLGMATANSLAGLLAGATGVQCSVLGLGERAGNAPLEEVALSLHVIYGRNTGLKLNQLPELGELVSHCAREPISRTKPVLGEYAFVHESGLHVDGLLRDPSTYEGYAPELIGRHREIVFGKHSGRSGLAQAMEKHKLPYGRTELDSLLAIVKDRTGSGPLTEEELVELAVQKFRPISTSPFAREDKLTMSSDTSVCVISTRPFRHILSCHLMPAAGTCSISWPRSRTRVKDEAGGMRWPGCSPSGRRR